MIDQPTCGKGLAEYSALPGAMGALVAATADTLELHMAALDLNDEHSVRERDAYRELADAHRAMAGLLLATAARMDGYRDLPMGKHDMAAMQAPGPLQAFERFVELEGELFGLLDHRLRLDRAMLATMRGG